MTGVAPALSVDDATLSLPGKEDSDKFGLGSCYVSSPTSGAMFVHVIHWPDCITKSLRRTATYCRDGKRILLRFLIVVAADIINLYARY